MQALIYLLLSLIFLGGFFCGAFLVFFPKQAITLQIKFYRLINWNMEPVDFSKEVRNTRVMGWIIIIFLIISLLITVIFKHSCGLKYS